MDNIKRIRRKKPEFVRIAAIYFSGDKELYVTADVSEDLATLSGFKQTIIKTMVLGWMDDRAVQECRRRHRKLPRRFCHSIVPIPAEH